jgi:hypothetical protein
MAAEEGVSRIRSSSSQSRKQPPFAAQIVLVLILVLDPLRWKNMLRNRT